MQKFFIYLTLLLTLIPSVFADIIALPSPGQYTMAGLILLIFNYIVNVILIAIQSKIWLHLGAKKIFAGLAIITPIMFVVEGFVLWLIQLGPYYRAIYENILVLLLFAVINFVLIFANYFFLAKHFWQLNQKQALRTAIIMGIITNPALYYFCMFIYGNYLYILFYNPPPPNPYYGGPSPVPFQPPS